MKIIQPILIVLRIYYTVFIHQEQQGNLKELDNISKPCIQMIPNYIEHTYVSSSAEENDLLKNEIIKHLSLKQIKRANRIYVQLLYCYTMVFEYIGNGTC